MPGLHSVAMLSHDSAAMRLVHPVTLRYADASCERAYQERQMLLHMNTEPAAHNLHLVVALLHLCSTAILLEGFRITRLSLYIIVPYTLVAILHWLAASTRYYQLHRTPCVLAFEVAYAVICTDGLPLWVLVHEVADMKAYLRDVVLGSGVLLSFWLTWFSSKPFLVDLVVIPVHLVAIAAALIPPVCDVLEGSPFGRSTTSRIAAALNAVAMPQMPLASPMHHTCGNMLLLWQVAWCGALLCVRYNMEWKRREAFVAPALLASSWRGRVNMSAGMAQVQVAVLLHTYAVVWVLLQTWHA